MPAAAKPYDFNEFAAAPATAPEPAFRAADMEAARERARAEALESCVAKEAAEQTRLCAAIAERMGQTSGRRMAAIVGDMVASVEHPTAGLLRLLGAPFKFSDTPTTIRHPPPLLGEHTGEILRDDLEIAPEEIATLYAQRIV